MTNCAFWAGNLTVYGSPGGVGLDERRFTLALSALQSVDVGPVAPDAPVPALVRSEVAKVSPSFAPLSVALASGGPLADWSAIGCQIGNQQTCGDIAGSQFVCAFRDAAAMSGFYKSRKTVAEGFGKIASEIAEACSDGRLRCHRSWAAYLLPLTFSRLASLPRGLITAIEAVWRPPTLSSAVSVESEDFRRYWAFLNKPRVVTVQAHRELTTMGWYYDSQSFAWPVFRAFSQDGQQIPASVTRLPSPDLQPYFAGEIGYNRFKVVIRWSGRVCAHGLGRPKIARSDRQKYQPQHLRVEERGVFLRD